MKYFFLLFCLFSVLSGWSQPYTIKKLGLEKDYLTVISPILLKIRMDTCGSLQRKVLINSKEIILLHSIKKIRENTQSDR